MIEERIINIKGIDYIVSSDGKVYSTKNCGRAKYHQEIKQRKNADGYMQITVGSSNNRTQCRVHRIVAEAFIPNPNKLPEVNHKDCNRENNSVDNLEWCTHDYNVQYSIDSGNHISTKDLYGRNNPNFGNHKLAEIYANNPEYAKEKCGRPGGQNGRARKVCMLDVNLNSELNFDCMVDCAQYLIDNNFVRGKDVYSIVNKISEKAFSGEVYYKRFIFSFVD